VDGTTVGINLRRSLRHASDATSGIAECSTTSTAGPGRTGPGYVKGRQAYVVFKPRTRQAIKQYFSSHGPGGHNAAYCGCSNAVSDGKNGWYIKPVTVTQRFRCHVGCSQPGRLSGRQLLVASVTFQTTVQPRPNAGQDNAGTRRASKPFTWIPPPTAASTYPLQMAPTVGISNRERFRQRYGCYSGVASRMYL